MCTLVFQGAFGVVFKGDLRLSDGSMVPVAIKTIARKFSKYHCNQMKSRLLMFLHGFVIC